MQLSNRPCCKRFLRRDYSSIRAAWEDACVLNHQKSVAWLNFLFWPIRHKSLVSVRCREVNHLANVRCCRLPIYLLFKWNEYSGVVQAPDALYRVPEFKSYSINIALWAPILPLEKHTSKGISDLRSMPSLLECTYLEQNSMHTMIRGEIMWILQFLNISAAYWYTRSVNETTPGKRGKINTS